MKPNVIFIIAAVYGLVVGLPSIIAPQAMASMAIPEPPISMQMMIRFLGVAELGLGLIAWLVRNAEASKTRDNVMLGFTIYFALHALTSLYGQFTDTSVSMHWVMATIQGLIAIGFFTSARSHMSKVPVEILFYGFAQRDHVFLVVQERCNLMNPSCRGDMKLYGPL